MNSNDIKTVTLAINSEQAQRKLDEINKRLEEARKKKLEAFERGDGKALQAYAKEIKSLEAQSARLQSRASTVTQVLNNLDKATPRELKATIKEINRELNSGSVERGSEQWKVLTRGLQEANAELKKIKDEQKTAEKSLGGGGLSKKISKWGNDWSGLTVVVDSALNKLSAAKEFMEQFVDEYAEMAEHESGVAKYTGLAKEDVNALNESFKRLDTRTPREKLNDLAADAGRLGIQSKEAVLDFVEAADQINVALGEDLGEDAVKNIGKLAQMFGDDKTMGLKQAMLSTGSVINELAQSSSASEGYLMEFTSRLAGVGKQAGMTQADVMAFGSVLDQNMVNVEKGATALQNVITALYAKPAKLAKVAGLDVKKFTKLLETDGNAAVLKFIEALRRAGKMDALAPMLQDMKLSGSGVTQTLSTLAANLQQVKETQQQAARAFEEGTSVTNEFNTANNTAKAELEKAQKRAKDLRVELGQRLYPVFTGMNNAVVAAAPVLRSLISLLGVVVKFVGENARAIVTATVAVTAFTAVMKLHLTWQAICRAWTTAWTVVTNIQTAATVALTAAQHALNVAIKANGFAALASLILSAVAALGTWLFMSNSATEAEEKNTKAKKANASAMDEQRRKQELLNEVKKAQADSTKKERAQIEMLTGIIRDNSASIDVRRAAIAKLQQIVPGYHASISSSGVLIEKNTKAIDKYIAQLDRLALAQAVFEKLQENAKKQIDIDRAIDAWNKAIAYRDKQMKKPGHESRTAGPGMTLTFPGGKKVKSNIEGNFTRIEDERIQRENKRKYNFYVEQGKQIQKDNQYLLGYLKKHGAMSEYTKIVANGGVTSPLGNVSTFSPTAGGKGTGGSHGGGNGGSHGETDLMKKEREKLEKEAEKQRLVAKTQYDAGLIDHREYSAQKLDIDAKLYADERDLYNKNSEEWVKFEQKRLDVKNETRKENHAWSIHELDVEEKEELEVAKKNYLNGTVTEEQYEKKKSEIKLNYLKRRAAMSKLYGQEEAAAKYESEYDEAVEADALQRRKDFWQKVETLRKDYEQKGAKERMDIELKMLDAVYNATDETGKRIGEITDAEYERLKKLIGLKYNGLDGSANVDGTGEIADERRKKAQQALSDAGYGKDSGAKSVDASVDFGFTGVAKAANDIADTRKVYDNLKEMRDKDLISEQTYHDACKELAKKRFDNFQNMAAASFSAVNAIMSSASQLFQAQQAEEEAKVTAKYDAEIKAAGQNSARGKQLEEQKQKDLAKVKNKYNKKMMAVEIAQAVAQTAMNAIMAYGSVLKIPIVGPALAVAAAAAATAAGMIQIATIKKQHAAQSEGYYEGGFTGGNRWRRTAGVVHEGEFVANHEAVRNPNVLPVLQLIDHAQRTNRIARLTATDVSRAIAAPLATSANTAATASVAALQVADGGANGATNEVLTRLTEQIDQGIKAVVVIDGPEGLDRQWSNYNKMKRQ
jgi:TP901 family phage tail tape measure protein